MEGPPRDPKTDVAGMGAGARPGAAGVRASGKPAGPAHALRFTVSVRVADFEEATAAASSKRAAEALAAAALLQRVAPKAAANAVAARKAPLPPCGRAKQRCGYVALIGAPNAGKSTLLNQLVGRKLAIVTPKVQTTRSRLLGIAIEGEAQLIFVDTPGIFEPRRRLDRAMVAAAWAGAADADETVLLVDAAHGPTIATRSASSSS